MSFALSPPGDLIERAQAAGSLVMAQVTTVAQARHVAAQGVDIVCAQGGEAGGFGGTVGSLPLIPQVVDAVRPLPVVAAGGSRTGAGSPPRCPGRPGCEPRHALSGRRRSPGRVARADPRRGVRRHSEGRAVAVRRVRHGPPRMPTPFIDGWTDGERRKELREAALSGRLGELTPFTGQSAGLIRDVAPAAQIVASLAAEADATLNRLT